MLDWRHRLVLRAVEKGDCASESTGLRDLVAAGLVAEREGGNDVTPAGRVALDAGPGRWERIAVIVGSLALAILAIDAVAGWVT